MPETDGDLILLSALLEIFERLGFPVRFENLNVEDVKGKGGRCRVREKEMLIVEKSLTTRDKIDILIEELKLIPTEDVYLPPNVRKEMEKA